MTLQSEQLAEVRAEPTTPQTWIDTPARSIGGDTGDRRDAGADRLRMS
ncbi:hypothetical protein KO481_36555 [Nocardia sp. NEAU-G5]|uniref:Uncharacterized protein n=1 Tax=Nocardia albiluteola TaxID=2842303 RepID=A0ABS6BCU7_9NOCA|nr:hypothetical protein [Nocardia albiluteola]MBU3067019.1 hypothetical protein [Nocardia albiluteola]